MDADVSISPRQFLNLRVSYVAATCIDKQFCLSGHRRFISCTTVYVCKPGITKRIHAGLCLTRCGNGEHIDDENTAML